MFTVDLGKALQAGRVLDFGGVIVNEVPTWRADQMPYGGVRDSGNTREGPPYTVREMTERRDGGPQRLKTAGADGAPVPLQCRRKRSGPREWRPQCGAVLSERRLSERRDFGAGGSEADDGDEEGESEDPARPWPAQYSSFSRRL